MSVETFGASLKRERELRGISLEEVAQATRIHPKYIDALENEHFEKLPGLTFLKGYVRAYAEFVGLNVDEVSLHLEPLIAKMQEPDSFSPISRKKFYFMGWGLLCLGVGVFLVFRSCLR